MPEYADIYILAPERTPQVVANFLDAFIPDREEAAAEYEIPQYSASPAIIFSHSQELIDYCCSHPQEVHTVYWRANRNQKPEHAMAFFLKDANLILGVSTDAEDHSYIDDIVSKLKRYFGTDDVLMRYEECPPESKEAFKAEIKLS